MVTGKAKGEDPEEADPSEGRSKKAGLKRVVA